MSILEIEIAPNLLHSFRELRVSWFEANNMTRFAQNFKVSQLLQEVQAKWSNAQLTPEQLGQLPLLAPWRQAFAQQGVKPSKFRPSAEALIRRFAAGKYSAVGVRAVDVYNAISASNQVPMGAYDLGKLDCESICLRFATGTDRFSPLGGKSDEYALRETIPVYGAGSQILCWCFNHRDSQLTCVDDSTEDALFVAESISQVQYESHRQAMSDLRELLQANGARLSEVRWIGAG